MKQRIVQLDYLWDNYFSGNLLITFWDYHYAKYMFLTSLVWLIVFRLFLYREVLKF